MKKHLKSLLLVAIFACTTLPAWSQASTEGKDFWVANTIVCQPPTASSPAFPTIAMSAQKACKVTITDYAGNQLVTANVAAGSWTRFGDNTAAVDPADYYLDPSKWYPSTDNVNATDAYKHADKINNYGLHITATENISVFIIMRTPQYSMDASNALPITALQSEYYLQDFFPDANGVDKPVTMTTILATEDNTQVVITPKGNTYGKNNNGTPFTVNLNKGQTYYLISETSKQLAGTHIVAKGGKKIAVYVGSPVTRLPGGVAARDGLFEQMMPIDYWGTQFIATRSMQKDGNIIGITATQNGTELKIDGFTQTIINEGETYYLLLQGTADPYTKNQSKITCHIDKIIMADAAYIETSCPCAVINYDTGNSFKGDDSATEIENGQGDPSSVWISPIQQKIGKITFGACYTKKTEAHFLNVVTETATRQETKLTAYMGQYGNDWSSKLSWTQVPGNPTYSYARVQIGNKTPDINVFTLENTHGFIAHVYGNGEDESYAYSAGSAAVERGINVNGVTMTDKYRSNDKFCFGDVITFDANVGTDQISRVDWNFGDGTTLSYGPSTTTHTYTSPGWYDVTADLYGHQVCTPASEQSLGSVSFSFRIVRPDTVFGDIVPKCISLADYKANPTAWDDSIAHPRIDTVQEHCYDTVFLNYVIYNRETEEEKATLTGQDSVYGYNGKVYYASQDVEDTVPNAAGCNHFIRYSVKVVTCLDMSVKNNPAQYACPGDNFSVTYTKKKGDIDGKATLKIPGYDDQEIDIPNTNVTDASLTIPVASITRPGIYKAKLLVKDLNCGDTKSFDIDFKIYYPKNIFAYKFNNVLAVYQKGYGGNSGFDFVAYQWYLNGVAIPGATNSIYHTDEPFSIGDFYSVELTDQNGMTLQSCSQEISTTPDYKPQPSAAPATKKVINNRIYIIVDERMYDAYGTRVQ